MTQSLSQPLKLDFCIKYCSFPCRLVSLTAALLHFYSLSLPTNPFPITTATAIDTFAYWNLHGGKKMTGKKKKQSKNLDWSHFDQFDAVVMVTQHPSPSNLGGAAAMGLGWWWLHLSSKWWWWDCCSLPQSINTGYRKEDRGQKSKKSWEEKGGVSPLWDKLWDIVPKPSNSSAANKQLIGQLCIVCWSTYIDICSLYYLLLL